jgi:hypothetical protein
MEPSCYTGRAIRSKTNEGELIMVYSGVSECISRDEGKSWDVEREIILTEAPVICSSAVDTASWALQKAHQQLPKIKHPIVFFYDFGIRV